MVKSQMRSPTVFISCSHDSEKHSRKVLALSNRLRQEDDINAVFDQYEDSPAEGWPRWVTSFTIIWTITGIVYSQNSIHYGCSRGRILSEKSPTYPSN